jgi:hypothetical protein
MIDVLITSASRPDSLMSEIKAFKKHVKYDGKMRFHLHEDRVPNMERKSINLIEWANRKPSYFTTVYLSNPRVGRGNGLNKLKKHANSKYIFYMEEDFDFIRDVNLNELIGIMERHQHINQIAFPWRSMVRTKKPGGPTNYFQHEERVFDGHVLRVTDRWTWLPALWRRSWLMPHWNFASQRSNKEFNGRFKKGIGQLEWDCKWQEKTFGAYFYTGKKGDSKIFVEHTSWDIRHDRMFL